MEEDIRAGTKKIYKSRQKMFKAYCDDLGCKPEMAPVNVVLNFFSLLHSVMGYSYQSICGFRSAISKMHEGWYGKSLGEALPIHRMIKAVYNLNPPQPRYADTWDPEQLLGYLETLGSVEDLSDMDLSIRTASLLAVATISRQAEMLMRMKTNHISLVYLSFLQGLEPSQHRT